jgi:hypothetical protein
MNRKNFLKTVGAGSLGLALSPLSLLSNKIPTPDIKESENKVEISLHFEDGKCLRFNDGMISSKDGLVITDYNIREKLDNIWNKAKNWQEDDSEDTFKNYNSIVNQVNDILLEANADCVRVKLNDRHWNYYFNAATVSFKMMEDILEDSN